MKLWNDILDGEAYKSWMNARLSGSKITQGVRLDPFNTSMRNLKKISGWLKLIESGEQLEARGGSGEQNLTDLRSVRLLTDGDNLSSFGQSVLDQWRRLGIDDENDENEIKRSLVMVGEGVAHSVSLYQDALAFWEEIRSVIDFKDAVANTESLYLLSFLNKDVDDFNPWLVTRDLGLSFSASGNVEQLKNSTLFGAPAEQGNISKLENWLTAFSTRAKPRQIFCLAMEIIAGGDSSINEIFNESNLLALIGSGNLITDIQKIYQEQLDNSATADPAKNLIFYGPPGTGKSFEAVRRIKGWEREVVIFHPAYDYSSFVGYYKPISEYNTSLKKHEVLYRYTPQAFMKLYVAAWLDLSKPHCLLIEEINRGGCAQIFGDIFQLLDRDDDGFSKYSISLDGDISNYLKGELESSSYGETIKKLYLEQNDVAIDNPYSIMMLPGNLSIYATMNTSDQSLFPMDSAFKRRWEWKYVPIDYVSAEGITLDIDGEKYSWSQFIRNVNKRILAITESEDKQIGNYFVNPKDKVVKADLFVNKVMFYLWSDVFKEEDRMDENNIFSRKDENGETVHVSYSELFSGNSEDADMIKSLLAFNSVDKIP
jgi:hypothetical protein